MPPPAKEPFTWVLGDERRALYWHSQHLVQVPGQGVHLLYPLEQATMANKQP